MDVQHEDDKILHEDAVKEVVQEVLSESGGGGSFFAVLRAWPTGLFPGLVAVIDLLAVGANDDGAIVSAGPLTLAPGGYVRAEISFPEFSAGNIYPSLRFGVSNTDGTEKMFVGATNLPVVHSDKSGTTYKFMTSDLGTFEDVGSDLTVETGTDFFDGQALITTAAGGQFFVWAQADFYADSLVS